MLYFKIILNGTKGAKMILMLAKVIVIGSKREGFVKRSVYLDIIAGKHANYAVSVFGL